MTAERDLAWNVVKREEVNPVEYSRRDKEILFSRTPNIFYLGTEQGDTLRFVNASVA